MLGAALAGEGEGPRGWLPLPSSDRERKHYRGLMRTAERLGKIVDENQATGNTVANGAMLQFGMLMGIAKDWNGRRVRPVTAKMFTQRTTAHRNLATENRRRTSDAEVKIINAVTTWQRKVRSQLWKEGKPLPARKRAELFLIAKRSTYKPRSSQRRRLFVLADSGRLPDPPADPNS
jgi:hypothetical protein